MLFSATLQANDSTLEGALKFGFPKGFSIMNIFYLEFRKENGRAYKLTQLKRM